MTKDVEKVREVLRGENYLAPVLDEARPVYDSEKNLINIELTGKKGPIVEVSVEAERDKVGTSTQTRFCPLSTKARFDYSAIIEGERRLENYYQEHGYFFVNVPPFARSSRPLPTAASRL